MGNDETISLENKLLRLIENNSNHNFQDIKYVYNKLRSIDATIFIINVSDMLNMHIINVCNSLKLREVE
jgi:hypothetical protein